MKIINNILMVFSIGLFGQAHASIYGDGATFGFGGLDWITDYDGGTGFVDDDPDGNGIVDSVKITGSDDGGFNLGGPLVITEMSTTALGPVDISFDWDFITADFSGPLIFDFFVSILDSGGALTFFDLTVENGGAAQTGSESYNLAAGDLFFLSIDSSDNSNGAAMVTIDNFSSLAEKPAIVPLPPAIVLFGSAFAGIMGFMRRKRTLKTEA